MGRNHCARNLQLRLIVPVLQESPIGFPPASTLVAAVRCLFVVMENSGVDLQPFAAVAEYGRATLVSGSSKSLRTGSSSCSWQCLCLLTTPCNISRLVSNGPEAMVAVGLALSRLGLLLCRRLLLHSPSLHSWWRACWWSRGTRAAPTDSCFAKLIAQAE